MKIITATLVTLLTASSAMAIDMPADGKSKCGACHSIDKKSVGPSWNAVAAKYKGQADAEATLVANITKGGKYGWDMGVMPAKGLGANDKQIAALSKFIAVDLNQ
ncbi:MAG: c-type cytochrome [Gallionella sp.]|nr:c-type cytochrome [Gallionella sp.]